MAQINISISKRRTIIRKINNNTKFKSKSKIKKNNSRRNKRKGCLLMLVIPSFLKDFLTHGDNNKFLISLSTNNQ